MATLGTKLFIKYFCKFFGTDEFGNSYYQAKKPDSNGRHRRYVIYKGIDDASKIPATWHAWLHYTIDDTPLNQVHYNWEKTHIPNLSGTGYRYLPAEDVDLLNKREFKSYQAWKPNN